MTKEEIMKETGMPEHVLKAFTEVDPDFYDHYAVFRESHGEMHQMVTAQLTSNARFSVELARYTTTAADNAGMPTFLSTCMTAAAVSQFADELSRISNDINRTVGEAVGHLKEAAEEDAGETTIH